MKLRLVAEVSFSKSERTNYDELRPKVALAPDEVICFVSLQRRQVVFVWKPTTVVTARGKEVEVTRSTRLRLTHAIWNPLMIQNYANEVGIKLDGLRRFEEIFAGAQAAKKVKS